MAQSSWDLKLIIAHGILSMSKTPHYNGTSQWIRAINDYYLELIVTWLHLQRLNFQIKSLLQVQELGLDHLFLRNTIQPTAGINR